jgi:hypothetical protein
MDERPSEFLSVIMHGGRTKIATTAASANFVSFIPAEITICTGIIAHHFAVDDIRTFLSICGALSDFNNLENFAYFAGFACNHSSFGGILLGCERHGALIRSVRVGSFLGIVALASPSTYLCWWTETHILQLTRISTRIYAFERDTEGARRWISVCLYFSRQLCG